jgi:hypothetical protein
MLKHCAANRKRRLSAMPNASLYIYDVSRLRLNVYKERTRTENTWFIFQLFHECVFARWIKQTVICPDCLSDLIVDYKQHFNCISRCNLWLSRCLTVTITAYVPSMPARTRRVMSVPDWCHALARFPYKALETACDNTRTRKDHEMWLL